MISCFYDMFFSCLFDLTSTPSTTFKRNGYSRDFFFLLILIGWLGIFFHWSLHWFWVCHTKTLLCWVMYLPVLSPRHLLWRDARILSKTFSSFVNMIMLVLFLNSFMKFIMFIDLYMMNIPCSSWIKPTFSWWKDLVKCAYIQLVRISLVILYLCSLNFLACCFLFL